MKKILLIAPLLLLTACDVTHPPERELKYLVCANKAGTESRTINPEGADLITAEYAQTWVFKEPNPGTFGLQDIGGYTQQPGEYCSVTKADPNAE